MSFYFSSVDPLRYPDIAPRSVSFGGHSYAINEEGRVLSASPEAWEALWGAPTGVILKSGMPGSPGPYPETTFWLPAFDVTPDEAPDATNALAIPAET